MRTGIWSAVQLDKAALTIVFVALLPFGGVPAYAQAPAVPASPALRMPWEITATIGFLTARPDLPATNGYYDRWFQTAMGGVIVGRHLTPHLRVELELGASREGRQFVTKLLPVPGVAYPVAIGAERYQRGRDFSGSLSWQFFDNEWVHPFVHAGVAASVERVRFDTLDQRLVVGDPRSPIVVPAPFDETPVTNVRARVVVGAGTKIYVSPAAFVRTDAKVSAGGDGTNVGFRIGIGVQF